MQVQLKGKYCRAILDRLILTIPLENQQAPPIDLQNYETERDHRLKQRGTAPGYSRCRELRNAATGTTLSWQYQPLAPWLDAWKITLIADDARGLSRQDVPAAFENRNYKLITAEVALDFTPESGVDAQWITRHAVFGKSRLVQHTDRPGQAYFGSRKSGKYVRCYQKEELGVFRVELECHGQLLRSLDMTSLDDLSGASCKLCPAHVRFVDLSTARLDRYLGNRPAWAREKIINEAHQVATGVQDVLRFLRERKIDNPHRFLRTRIGTRWAKRALKSWGAGWSAK